MENGSVGREAAGDAVGPLNQHEVSRVTMVFRKSYSVFGFAFEPVRVYVHEVLELWVGGRVPLSDDKRRTGHCLLDPKCSRHMLHKRRFPRAQFAM